MFGIGLAAGMRSITEGISLGDAVVPDILAGFDLHPGIADADLHRHGGEQDQDDQADIGQPHLAPCAVRGSIGARV